jgi:phosphoribosyl-ATP pyrophosphohydrolase
MREGLRGKKGRIHFTFGKPLKEELEQLKETNNKNEQFQKLAEIIDEQIHNSYKLWPGNFVAADIQSDSNKFAHKYSEEEKNTFLAYIEKHTNMIEEGDKPFIRKMLIDMYANPVKNFYKES